MPTPALLLAIATLLPLAAFIVLVFFGKRMGNPFAGYFGTAMIAGSFVCSIIAMMSWMSAEKGGEPWGFNKQPYVQNMRWIPVGSGVGQEHTGYLDVGIHVDSLTIAMFSMITLVAMLVHIFSIGYMHEDKRFPRFFTYLGLFCFSMLGLVIGGTVLHLFIFWELVGLCSYLLIGFWYEKKSASNAAIKAFVTNRVGDFGFLIGFGILFYHLGNVTLVDMWKILSSAGAGGDIALSNHLTFTNTLLTITGIGLFFGAVGKSAQFPLHVWLPDAMEGPTPVSALIHAATMVAAGVYLVGRIFPILTPDARLFIAIIGCVTLVMAALIAIAQSDIKKVLAYSTLSQLGYMILAMGVGSWVGGLFHLITHAFFKALLFLGSGSVIHAAHHEQELPQYGGLIRKIPITGFTFLIAVFAIAGFSIAGWGFAGFYSKDMILQHAAAFGFAADHFGKSNYLWLLWLCPTIIAYVTPFYMMRCWMLTFWGKPRNQHLYDHAHETPILWLPLVVLAVAAVVGGKYLGVREMIEAAPREANHLVSTDVFKYAWPTAEAAKHGEAGEGATAAASVALPLHEELLEKGEHKMHQTVGFAWLAGIGLAFVVYLNGYSVTNVLMKIPPVAWIHYWLKNRMFFDDLYNEVFVGGLHLISAIVGWFDRVFVDGFVNFAAYAVRMWSVAIGNHDKYVVDGAVNGAGKTAFALGNLVRNPGTGRVRMYVTAFAAAGAIGLGLAVFFMSH